jgi:hypothetical protein
MFNEYGYDYFNGSDLIDYDESFYTEMMKPMKTKENFENEIDEILEEIEPQQYNKSNYMQQYINKKNVILNNLNNQCKYYKHALRQKYNEVLEKNNQLFMFYIIIFISILIIVYQKISMQTMTSKLENMKNLIYVLKMALTDKKSV